MNYYDIISSVPSDLNKLEIARFLYIRLGTMFSFSTVFNNSESKVFYKMMVDKIDAKTFKSPQVNCNYWAQIYSQLLTYFGIDNKIVHCGHKFVKFYIDNFIWIADATYGNYTDLARIQNGDETSSFGLSIDQINDRESNAIYNTKDSISSLNNIDVKFGYDKKKKNVKIFKQLLNDIRDGKVDIASSDIISKMDFLVGSVGNLSIGYYEAKDFFYNLERNLFNEDELKRIGATELKRTNFDNSVDIIQCIYVNTDNGYDYYILCPNLPVKKISSDDIIKLSVYGFGLDEKVIPNIDYPKNFKKSKSFNFSKLLSLSSSYDNVRVYNFSQEKQQRSL